MDRIIIDASNNHPTLTFVQDRETRDTFAVDRATGVIVGSHRGDYRRPLSAELVEAALDAGPRAALDLVQ
jgi:hypothetical protein